MRYVSLAGIKLKGNLRVEVEGMKKEWMQYYKYLEELRQSGITNMFGASPYLQEEFDLDRKEADEILMNWMRNYEEIIKEIESEVK